MIDEAPCSVIEAVHLEAQLTQPGPSVATSFELFWTWSLAGCGLFGVVFWRSQVLTHDL